MSMIPDENPPVLYADHPTYVKMYCGKDSDEVHEFGVFIPRTPTGSPPPETSSPQCVVVPRSPPGNPTYNDHEEKKVLPKSNAGEQRKVELPKFMSRRAELLEANKPVYNYYPKILSEYLLTDYLRHLDIFKKASLEDQKAAQPGSSKETKERQVCLLSMNAAALKEQIKPIHLKDLWYLVVDTKILLEDMFFVEKLVKSDKHCRLHLPYEVFHDLTAMTRRSLPAYIRIPARRVAQFHKRLLKLGKGQGAIEAEDVLDSVVAFDSVINCCMQLMRRYYYVVLITNDPDRKIRANYIDLPCYNLKDTKELTAKELVTVTIRNGFKHACLP